MNALATPYVLDVGTNDRVRATGKERAPLGMRHGHGMNVRCITARRKRFRSISPQRPDFRREIIGRKTFVGMLER